MQEVAARWLITLAALLAGCQREGGAAPATSSQPSGVASLPPGMCACPCSAAPPAPSPAATAGDLAELSAGASRKMMHGDGAGCLADLDALARIDPRLGAQLDMIRGQCEMLVGRCQDGKRRVASYYMTESAMSAELAAKTAESLVGMRCRGGDSTPRDELLRAFFELQDGAYMNGKTPAECRASLDAARRLEPLVTLGPAGDEALAGAEKALFFTAAQCFAKAGDCAGAWAAYRDNYPAESLAAIADPKAREKAIADAFRSSVDRCKDALP